MNIDEIYRQFIHGMKQTTMLEYIAVTFGILSVWFSRLENILVYPVGLVSTIIYVYLSIRGSLLGEASVNLFYTIMSIYGWYLWTRKDRLRHPVLHISFSGKKEWTAHLVFFMVIYVAILVSLAFMKRYFTPGAIPWADAFASATAYTGMWLMAKKKVESWWWWIATDAASVPLYYVKGLVFTSVYYVVLLVLAVFGLVEWQRRARATGNGATFAVENT